MLEKDMPGWKSDLMWQGHPQFLQKIAPNIEELRKVLNPDHSLVDVGCCEGHLYSALRHQNYLGVDLFEKNIEKARQIHPEAEFRCQDLFELDGKWDVVWCSRVLIHIPNFHEAVERLLSCARKYCFLVIPVTGDSCEIERVEGENKLYFRTFSGETVRKCGECEIISSRSKYSTVIFRL